MLTDLLWSLRLSCSSISPFFNLDHLFAHSLKGHIQGRSIHAREARTFGMGEVAAAYVAGALSLDDAAWIICSRSKLLLRASGKGAMAVVELPLEQAKAIVSDYEERVSVAVNIVYVIRGDVAQQEHLENILTHIRRTMPPLRGIFHSAIVLNDGTLLQQDREHFLSVMPPKIDGAWNLHCLTLDDPLDYFVLFSSAASLIGSPGQGNHAAANPRSSLT